MPKKINKKVEPQKFDYASPSVATGLIIIGLFFKFGLAITVGVILGLVWMFRFTKSRPKLRIVWWVLIGLLLTRSVIVLAVGIHKYF